MEELPCGQIGKVTDSGKLFITSQGEVVVEVDIGKAKAAWQKTFKAS
jgi:hypothetical protein